MSLIDDLHIEQFLIGTRFYSDGLRNPNNQYLTVFVSDAIFKEHRVKYSEEIDMF